MLWERISTNPTTQWALSAGLAVFIILLLLLLRRILYGRLHRWASRTATKWDDVIIGATRLPSLLWCLWLGAYAGLQARALPPQWLWVMEKLSPALFVALGTYTVVMAVQVSVKWYALEVASRTRSRLDDAIAEFLRFGVPIVGLFLGLTFILDNLGVDVQAIKDWLALHGVRLALLLALGIAFLMAATTLIPGMINTFMARVKAEETDEELKKRTETLVGVLTAFAQVVIITAVFLMVLSEFQINIATILAGVGVAGVAIGFGAQSLVKDLIAGLFIIFENQYRKGDVVRIADIAGLVEDINLRKTTLRDLDGIVHVVPNGEIRVASNFTKLWSRVNLNISVSYGTDLDHAIAVINKVGKELAEDEKWSGKILKPPQVLRVDNLGDSGIDIKILGDTKPIQQWDVMGELRLRLKKAFDEEGIEIPWPHTKVYFGEPLPGSLFGHRKETDSNH